LRVGAAGDLDLDEVHDCDVRGVGDGIGGRPASDEKIQPGQRLIRLQYNRVNTLSWVLTISGAPLASRSASIDKFTLKLLLDIKSAE
jgi:hypothetical protein